jgi:uncharacterized Zn-finger protein
VNEQLHVQSAECRYSCDIRSDGRQYSCEVFTKKFNEKNGLIRHQHIRSSERPYSCDVCKKAFSQQGNLITHQRIHSSEHPYSCDVCNKAFSQQRNLITHQCIHSGERPYSCDLCNKAFSHVPVFSSIGSMTPDYRESKCFLRGPEFLRGLTTTNNHSTFDVT